MIKPGSLVRWRYTASPALGTVLADLGVKTFTRKYLIYWHTDGIILENYEADIEELDHLHAEGG